MNLSIVPTVAIPAIALVVIPSNALAVVIPFIVLSLMTPALVLTVVNQWICLTVAIPSPVLNTLSCPDYLD